MYGSIRYGRLLQVQSLKCRLIQYLLNIHGGNVMFFDCFNEQLCQTCTVMKAQLRRSFTFGIVFKFSYHILKYVAT